MDHRVGLGDQTVCTSLASDCFDRELSDIWIRIKKQESNQDKLSRRSTVVGRLWDSDKFTKERDQERYSSTEEESEDDNYAINFFGSSEEPEEQTVVLDTGMFSVKVSSWFVIVCYMW